MNNNIERKPFIAFRVLAGIIDYSLIILATIILIITLGEPNSSEELELTGALAFSPILIWSILTFGMESIIGSTLGNYLFDLRPVP